VAGAAPAIEDGRTCPAAHGFRQKWRHEAPESLEPEMIPLGERRGLKKSIHYADRVIDSAKNGR